MAAGAEGPALGSTGVCARSRTCPAFVGGFLAPPFRVDSPGGSQRRGCGVGRGGVARGLLFPLFHSPVLFSLEGTCADGRGDHEEVVFLAGRYLCEFLNGCCAL